MGIVFTADDTRWMRQAIQLAEFAAHHNEVPVGAVLVLNDQIIGQGFNQPISHCDPTAHAELVAVRHAAQQVGNYRIIGATLYVTLEPCLMCVGALTHARIHRVVYGATEPKGGAVCSAFTVAESEKLNHKIIYQGGLLATECGRLLQNFFCARRKRVLA